MGSVATTNTPGKPGQCSTQHLASAHTCVLWGISAHYSLPLLHRSYILAVRAFKGLTSSRFQSLACPSREIPTAISWSSQLLRRSESNMAGDAVMAALRENGSKHGVSAGNEVFLQCPWVVNNTIRTDNETLQCQLYIL
ncbi:hypothetical protein J3E68DRAFT_139667 [Trichoderma sp. SZMC 28012]